MDTYDNFSALLKSNNQSNDLKQDLLKAQADLPKEVIGSGGTSQKKYDKNGYEIMDFFTDYGTQRVTIDGDITSTKPVIVTYHDIGINHTACYQSFFNMMREYDPKFQYFTIVHIDAPQHHFDDAERTDSTTTTSKSFHNESAIEAFDLLELSSQIEEIRSKLQLDRFIGFGVGAACNIWTYYAMHYSQRMRGLILLNGIGSAASWREWIFDKMMGAMGASSQFLIDSLASSLLTRYFPGAVSKETIDYFMDTFDKMDRQSVIKYFRGFVRRSEFSEAQLAKIKVKTLIICGEFSRVKEETIAFQKIMPRRYTTFVLMNDTGFLLTESHPQKLCSSIDLFVQSTGLTTISLAKKYGKIEKNAEIKTIEL